MYDVFIVFASATTANRVKSVLSKKYAVNSEVMQTPKTFPSQGCSYSLFLNSVNLNTAWQIVTGSSLSTKGAYRRSDYVRLK